MSNQFALNNEPPRSTPPRFESNSKTRQRVLFAGMNCLPGQLDLFPTDGDERAQGESVEDTVTDQTPPLG